MATAVAEPDTSVDFEYPITVEDAGPATKKVTVEVPEARISSLIEQQIGEVRGEVQVPGFRRGKAPRSIVQKKFGSYLKQEVRGQVVRESYEQALAKHDLKPLGEPDFGEKEIELPEAGALSYSFQLEVQPTFDLPDVSAAKIKKPKVDITDDHVDQAMNNLREQQGTLVPVEDRGVQAKDYMTADVTVKHGEETLAEQKDAQLVARSGRIHGILIEDLADKLDGLKIDESRSFTVKVPDDHPTEKLRGQDVEVTVELKDLKELELAEIDEQFLEEMEFENEGELREALREQMVLRVENDVKRTMRQQMTQYLIDNTKVDLPAKLSEQQTQRVVQRRAMGLLQRGVPQEQVVQNIERVKAGADADAKRELHSFFVVSRFAEERNIEVAEDEVNGRIALMAMEMNQRPEALKQKMAEGGDLQNLMGQMREEATLDALVADAQVEEVAPADPNQIADEATGHQNEAVPADDAGDDVT
jgi:trigger factor